MKANLGVQIKANISKQNLPYQTKMKIYDKMVNEELEAKVSELLDFSKVNQR